MASFMATREISYVAKSWCFHLLLARLRSSIKKRCFSAYEIEEFLPPLKALANMCGMEFAGYVYSGGLSYQSRHDEAKLALMRQKALDHAKRLEELIGKIS